MRKPSNGNQGAEKKSPGDGNEREFERKGRSVQKETPGIRNGRKINVEHDSVSPSVRHETHKRSFLFNRAHENVDDERHDDVASAS